MDKLQTRVNYFNIGELMDLPLLEIPNKTWESKYKNLLKDDFLKNKYNRDKRIKDKISYINNYAPELKKSNGLIIDLGPGPGEFLEICKFYGNDVLGIDSKPGTCGMGEKYLSLSKLLTQRQKIKVLYEGVNNLLNNKLPLEDNSVFFVNSQGSIEQIFQDFFIKESVDFHSGYRYLEWDFNNPNLIPTFTKFISEIKRILVPSGRLLIYGNGTASNEGTRKYRNMLVETINKIGGFEIEFEKNDRLHKFKKI